MLHIKCRNCGFRFPFSNKKKGYTVKSILGENTMCPSCGQILITKEKKQ
jgi:predicted RNA-binding Zn-ribbon protein involved in translation (DUF1610 family)